MFLIFRSFMKLNKDQRKHIRKEKQMTKFVLNETSYFGKGARQELPEEIKQRGF